MQDWKIQIDVINERFLSRPVIFHHPGRVSADCLNDIGEIVALKQILFRQLAGNDSGGTFVDRKEAITLNIPTRTLPMAADPFLTNELTIIFASNLQEKGSMPRLLEYFGIDYHVLGQNIRTWRNIHKIRLISDYLKSVVTPFVVFFDCDDTFVIAHLRAMLETFRSKFTCKMLVMGGEVLWPPVFKTSPYRRYSDFLENVPESRTSNHMYLNSGGWISHTEFAKTLFADLESISFDPFPFDDQPRFWMLYPEYYPDLLIDYECQIFQCEFSKELLVEGLYRPSDYFKRKASEPLFKS